jgi:tRNA(Glu) U13 pseudouridine synthase TruD
MSVPRDVVDAENGKELLLSYLQQDIEVIRSDRHDRHLEIGRHRSNQFTITLKAKNKAEPAIKKMIEAERKKINERGFPNCFGIQRFGPGNKNYHKATELLKQAETIPDSQYVLRFIVQAYPSMLFNQYAMQRRRGDVLKKNASEEVCIEGDILVTDPTPRRKDYYIYQKEKITSFDYVLCKQKC